MRTKLWLVLKHITGSAEKVNTVYYLTKQPPPVDDYYYEEETYAVKDQMGGLRQNVLGFNKENRHQGQGNQG